MKPDEQNEAIVDTYIEDYEEFLDEDDRWRPNPRSTQGHRDRGHAVRPPEQGKKR